MLITLDLHNYIYEIRVEFYKIKIICSQILLLLLLFMIHICKKCNFITPQNKTY